MRTANAFSGPRRCSVAQFDSWDFNLKLATNSFPLSKFKPNLGAELPHFSNVKWLAGSPSKILKSHNFPLRGIRQKRGKRIWEIFQPGVSWASGIWKEGPSGRRQMWLDIWISGYFPGIKPIHGSKSLCVQGIALKWTISLFCKHLKVLFAPRISSFGQVHILLTSLWL